jgi:hypothetical protein
MPFVLLPTRKDIMQINAPNGTALPQSTPVADTQSIVLRLAMVCCLYAIPVFAAIHCDADNDIWWHLRVGQWVVDHGTVPTTDPCSSYGHDKAWVAYSWLFEVLVYGCYQAFGLLGIIFFRVVLCLGVTAALHRFIAKREPRFLIATALAGVAILGVAMLFKERPWLFTILFSILTLDVILDLRDGKRTVMTWLLPLVFVVWANVHIQFVYGLIFLFIACVAPQLQRLLRRGPADLTAATALSPGWLHLVALSGLCLLATFVNPYHVANYRVVIEYATQPGPFTYVNELKALEFREPSDWVMLLLAAGGCYALGRRQSLSVFDVLLLVFSGWLAFRSRRDMWVLIVASLYLLTTLPRKAIAEGASFRFTFPRIAGVAAGVLVLAAATMLLRQVSNEEMKQQIAKRYPVRAAEYVAEKHLSGPLYNDFNWGGYLIWALPELPVALDGRTNLYGDERIEHFGEVWSGVPDAADDPELLAAGVVISPKNSPRAALLLRDNRFEEVYKDDIARVFVRK